MINLMNNLIMFSFILSGYMAWTAFMAGRWRRRDMLASAERGAVALLVIVSLLMSYLIYAFIVRDFSLQYVASYSDRQLPLFYTIAALWAGQSGSLLLWTWLLTLFTALVVWQNRTKNRDLLPYVLGFLFVVTFFFCGIMLYATNPFELAPVLVTDGNGLNPMLQNPGMVMHPPTLFLGYVGFTVPYAFAMAALIRKKIDAQWIRSTRRWTLTAWLFLTLGNLFGAKWAYVELGWGGYWGWDPVENASLMPWLTATAYLHSVMIQERRGMLKIWNVVLIVLTFTLTIFGTFITRSGLIASVHSFGVSNLGPLFLLFLGIILVFSVGLLIKRRQLLRSEYQLDAILSRESSFLFNNLILLGIAFAVFWGTIFPILSETVRGVKITVGPPFYNQVNVPLGLALLALTGICPLIAWRKASRRNLQRNFLIPVGLAGLAAVLLMVAGIRSWSPVMSFSLSLFVFTTIAMEFHRGTRARVRIGGKNYLAALWDLTRRNKRRYGGYIVHVGVILVFIGITGSSAFQQEKEAVLRPGETLSIADYTLRYHGLEDQSTDRAQAVAARIAVEQSGTLLPPMYPSKQLFRNSEPVSEVAIRQTLKEDLYVILSGWDQDGRAVLKVLVNPLTAWIWIGGMVMILGTLIALGPERARIIRRERVRVRRPRRKEVEYVPQS
jgi:cytochrome c-type biogenesis protein CcmF